MVLHYSIISLIIISITATGTLPYGEVGNPSAPFGTETCSQFFLGEAPSPTRNPSQLRHLNTHDKEYAANLWICTHNPTAAQLLCWNLKCLQFLTGYGNFGAPSSSRDFLRNIVVWAIFREIGSRSALESNHSAVSSLQTSIEFAEAAATWVKRTWDLRKQWDSETADSGHSVSAVARSVECGGGVCSGPAAADFAR